MLSHAPKRTLAASLAFAASLAAAPATLADEPTLEQRLQRLEQRLDQARIENHVPALAIAVVKDDKVIFLRALGSANLEQNTPATPGTRFAIGSTTKAMTATLIAQLIDDGRMSWDDPVQTHLPEFRIEDDTVAHQVTIRDLLCHRVGLASMNALWYANDATQQDILDAVARAQLLHPFRERWNYSNISYLIAGIAAANAADADSWHTLIQDRLLQPLDIHGATTLYAAATADPHMARGYRWDEDDETWIHQPLRRLDTIGPAGSVNASAREMAQWVRLQLARGAIGDKRLVADATLAETWQPQIELNPDTQYALGWLVSQWYDHTVISHSGGIDGFTAQVALIPDQNLGFALLTNLFATPLAETSRPIVFEAILGDWIPEDQLASHEQFARYLGTYLGNFGQFKDAEFKVQLKNNRLAIDVPGQTVYELLEPDDEGKRPFALTDQIKIRFNENEEAEITSITLFQAGFNFDLPRQGVAQPRQTVDLASVRPLLGKYHFDALGIDVEILIQDDLLAIDVPGQTIYPLVEPEEGDDRWLFSIKDTIWVVFNRKPETDTVESITLVQEGNESLLPRTTTSLVEQLPSLEQFLADMHQARGGDAADALDSIRLAGQARLIHVGVDADASTLATTDGHMRNLLDMGVFGQITQIATPNRVWIESPSPVDNEPDAEMADAIRQQNPFYWLTEWHANVASASIDSRTTFDDTDVYKLSVRTNAGNEVTLFVDTGSMLTLASQATITSPLGIPVVVTTRLDDYRPVDGVLVPHLVRIDNQYTGRIEIRYTEVETSPELPPDAFRIPPS